MKYGVSIYGPFKDDHPSRQRVFSLVATAFPVEYKQLETLWSTMQNYPHFNAVEVIQRHDKDLVVHVYYSPPNLADDVDCAFHAKISPSGTYA